MNLPLFDRIFEGKPKGRRALTPAERAREGIQRAVDHANAKQPKWSDRAEAYAQAIIARFGQTPFLFEVIVEASRRDQEPQPPDARAWGHITRSLAKAGVIRKVGYAPAKTSNTSPKVLWQKVNTTGG